MNNTKSLLQRVQSRISKRRGMINALEELVEYHYGAKALFGSGTMTPEQLKQHKASIKAGAESQKLDKKIFQMLVAQERTKYDAYFRSAHKHWMVEALEESHQ